MITERLLDPTAIQIHKIENVLQITINNQLEQVDQIVRCFPFSTPNQWISFRKSDGSEIGLIQSTNDLNEDARQIVETHLKDRYHIPTIAKIENIESNAQGTQWFVETEEGSQSFSLRGERSVDLSEFPKVVFTDAATRQRFAIPNYTDLDRASQQQARAHLSIGRRGRGGRMRM